MRKGTSGLEIPRHGTARLMNSHRRACLVNWPLRRSWKWSEGIHTGTGRAILEALGVVNPMTRHIRGGCTYLMRANDGLQVV